MKGKETFRVYPGTPFCDIGECPYREAIARCYSRGWFLGMAATRFGPDRLQAVLELELAVVAVDVVDPEGGKLHHGRPYIVPKRYLIANVTAPNAAKRPQTKLNFILNW